MRFKIDHPTEPGVSAKYGWSRGIGWFVQVWRGARLVEDYDDLVPGHSTLAGVLRVLSCHGFFPAVAVGEAEQLLQVADVEDIEPGPVRLVAEVFFNLKMAGK